MNKYSLIVTPRQTGVSARRATALDVLVRLQAPDTPPAIPTQRRHGEVAAGQKPFHEEFDPLQDLCARHVRLRLSAAPGVRARVLNDYQVAGPAVWRLPDLEYAGEGWALVRVEISRNALERQIGGARMHLMELEVELVDTQSRERRFIGAALDLPVASGHNTTASKVSSSGCPR
jgi:hypothetical protein